MPDVDPEEPPPDDPIPCNRRTPKKCRPTVICTLRSESNRIYDYTILNATTAWIVKTCFDSSGTATETIIDITPVDGYFTADANCTYRIYAKNCGTVSDSCSDPVTSCFPCGTELGELLYGVMIISDIPDNLPANCAVGYGYQSAEWEGFGDWNGTVIWDAAMVGSGLYIQMGAGRMRASSGASWIDVAYGIFVQCSPGGAFSSTGRPAFTVGSTVLSTGGGGTGSGASWDVTTLTEAGRCNYKSATTNSGAPATYSTCPFNGGFAIAPNALPLAYSNIITWDVAEFS